MNMLKSALLAVVGVLIIVGCGSTSAVRLTEQTFEEKPSDCKIDVLSESPSRKHIKVAMVSASSGSTIFHKKSVEGVLPQIKAEACKVGADAVILGSSSEGNWLTGESGKVSGTAIRYMTAE